MAFHLPALSYGPDSLAPYLSEETLRYHYGKHHQAYVDKTNQLIETSDLRDGTLEEIVRGSNGTLFNNAAQAWNHTFYWECLSPDEADRKPSQSLEDAICKAFGDRRGFLEKFATSAMENFGSGWTWLVRNGDGALSIQNSSNAGTPIKGGFAPLLVVDVWEHAYYIDYRNERKKYLESFMQVVNWRFVSERFDAQDVFNATNLMRGKLAA